MNSESDLINLIKQNIGDHLTQFEEDAQIGRELRVVIRNHLEITRNLVIWRKADHLPYRVEPFKGQGVLFESASYIACVEWALKQPMKAATDEQK